MPFKLQRLGNEPIIVVELSGHLNVELLREMYADFTRLAQTIPGHVYRITNFQNVDSNFHDMLDAIQDASSGSSGTATDPRLTAVYFGSDQWANFALESLKQTRFGSLSIPMFRSLDDALTAIRLQIAATSSADASTNA